MVKVHATDLNEEVITELRNKLDSNIKRVAWRCGVWIRCAVRKPLRMEVNNSSFDAKRTEIVLEEPLPAIMSAAKVPSGP